MKNYFKIQIIGVLLLLLIDLNALAQVSTGVNYSATNTDFVGWDNSVTFDLNVKHDGNYNINFKTNGSQKMMINAGGNVSIGNTNNSYKLDVSGDVNSATSQRYRISGANFLSGPGFGTNNTFVGVQTDLSGSNATDNTFVGYNSGNALNGGDYNTLIGSQAGAANTADKNTFIGSQSGLNNTSGNANTFLGYESGKATTVNTANTFIGYRAGLVNNDGSVGANASNNTFVGSSAGITNTTGPKNSFFGSEAGLTNLSGQHNTYLGYTAARSNSTGDHNVAIGSGSGYSNTASYNVIVGKDAGYFSTSQKNVIMGYQAGRGAGSTSNNDNNTFIGYQAGFAFATNSYNNTFIGYAAGDNETDGNTITLLGYNTSYTSGSTLTNATALGANASVTASNNVILGNSCNVGIGTTAASRKLHVVGDIRVTGAYYDSNNDPGTSGQILSTTVTGTDWINNTGLTGPTGATGPTGVNSFALCGSAGAAALAQNSEMPLNNYNLKFSGHGSGTNLIGIGITGCSPAAKLDVVNTTEDITGRFYSSYASTTSVLNVSNDNTVIDPAFTTALGPTAVYGSSYNSNGGVGGLLRGRLIGLYGHALGDFEDLSTYGVWGISDNSLDDNYGVRGDAIGNNSQENTFLQNFGVHGSATGESLSNDGVFGTADGDSEDGNRGIVGVASGSGTLNYGVYGSYSGTQDQYNCAGYFNGDGFATGAFYDLSDINLKQNIQDLSEGLAIITQLNPKSYEFRVDEYPQINLSQGTNYGLIAQEVESIIPSIVEDFLHPVVRDTLDSLVYVSVPIKAINYSGLVPFLIAAIKEQQQQIDDLNSRLTSCCGPGIQEFQVPDNGYNQPSTINHQELVSVARDLPVLSQNQPNPFNEKTLIRFYIPKATKDASVKVFDNTGSVYRLFAVTGEGPGTIEIEGSTLAAGNYYYSLLIGGNVIDTKTMVITK